MNASQKPTDIVLNKKSSKKCPRILLKWHPPAASTNFHNAPINNTGGTNPVYLAQAAMGFFMSKE